MEKLPIGVIIKKIVHQKNFSVKRLSSEVGISRQQVYNTYTRTNLHEGELAKWAGAFGMSVEELLNYGSDKVAPVIAESKLDDTLTEMKRMFEQELREKNEQIRALQEALRQAQNLSTALLGKSPERPDGRVLPNVFKRYDLPEVTAAVR